MVVTVALKVAEVLLAGTVANVGTGSDALLLESVTALPPDGAPWLRVIVQVVAAPELTWSDCRPRRRPAWVRPSLRWWSARRHSR